MKITGTQRVNLIGLLSLAKEHNEQLKIISRAMREITKEESMGHVEDTVYGSDITDCSISVDTMLKNMSIEVED